MAPLPRVRKRTDFRDVAVDDLAMALHYDRIADPLDALDRDDTAPATETKAGRRNSAADYAILDAMYQTTTEYAETMRASFQALGYTPQTPSMNDEGEPLPMATKALDLKTRCEMVCEAVEEALEEAGWYAEEDEETLTSMGMNRNAIIAIHEAAAMHDDDDDDDEDDDDHECFVYEDYAVLDLGERVYKIPYEIQGDVVVLADLSDWQSVQWDINEIEGQPFTEYLEDAKAVAIFDDTESAETLGFAPTSVDGGAIKAVTDRDDVLVVGGYAVLFGNEEATDLSPQRDYFTKSTDFLLDAWDRRPMIYHHAMEGATKSDPVVGAWTKTMIDEIGVWMEGELKKSHRYYDAIKELIKRGALRLSSDSAPHLVERERRPNGAHEVKRWGLIAASLTPSPAEPRMEPVRSVKSTEIVETLDNSETLRLALELELLALETEA
jgi:phage head maturation protease